MFVCYVSDLHFLIAVDSMVNRDTIMKYTPTGRRAESGP